MDRACDPSSCHPVQPRANASVSKWFAREGAAQDQLTRHTQVARQCANTDGPRRSNPIHRRESQIPNAPTYRPRQRRHQRLRPATHRTHPTNRLASIHRSQLAAATDNRHTSQLSGRRRGDRPNDLRIRHRPRTVEGARSMKPRCDKSIHGHRFWHASGVLSSITSGITNPGENQWRTRRSERTECAAWHSAKDCG